MYVEKNTFRGSRQNGRHMVSQGVSSFYNHLRALAREKSLALKKVRNRKAAKAQRVARKITRRNRK